MSQESTGSIIIFPRGVAVGDPAGDSLENINTSDLANGVLCYVASGTGKGGWQLEKDATNAPNGTTIVEPISGPGRWFKKLFPGPGGGGGGGNPSQGAVNTLNKADGAGGWLTTPFSIVSGQIQISQTMVMQVFGGTSDFNLIAERNINLQATNGSGSFTFSQNFSLLTGADLGFTVGGVASIEATDLLEVVVPGGNIALTAGGDFNTLATSQEHLIAEAGAFIVGVSGTGDTPLILDQTTQSSQFPGRLLGWNGTQNVYVDQQILSPYVSNDALTELPDFTQITYRTAFLTATIPRQCVLPALADTPDGSRYTIVDAAGTLDGIEVTVSGGAPISGIPVFNMTSPYQSQTFEKFNTQWYLI